MSPWDFVCWSMAVAASLAFIGVGVALMLCLGMGPDSGRVFEAMARRLARWIQGGRP